MRWIGASAVLVVLAWLVYLASPYWAAAQLTAALARADVGAVEARVNLRALKVSLTKQLVAEGLAASDIEDAIGSRNAQLAAGAVLAVADPLLAQFASARGAIDLARETGVPDLQPGSAARSASGRMLDLVRSSRWRGFRNVYVSLPAGRPPAEQVRLQFRLSRLSWRLVSLDLPASLRARLARGVERLKTRATP